MSLNRFFAYASAACGLVVLLVVVLACGGDGTGAACGQPAPGTHAVAANGFGCHIECEPGFFDCNGVKSDGCESSSACIGILGDAKAPPGPVHLVATLSGVPHGLAACAGNVYYFDDATLMTADGQKLFTLPAIPAGGIACDGANLYFATLSDGDSGPNGVVYRFHLGDSTVTPVASGVDPGRGVDVRGDSVYWIARSTAADAGSMLEVTTDAGSTALVPATETTTYKSFALLDDADYALADGSVWASPLDGSAPFTLSFDATKARALLRASAPLPAAVVATNTGDGIVVITEDASTQIASIAHIVATAANTTNAIFATDEGIYEWTLTNVGVKLLSAPYLHITDVTLDGTNAYWVTRGAAATPGALWKAGL